MGCPWRPSAAASTLLQREARPAAPHRPPAGPAPAQPPGLPANRSQCRPGPPDPRSPTARTTQRQLPRRQFRPAADVQIAPQGQDRAAGVIPGTRQTNTPPGHPPAQQPGGVSTPDGTNAIRLRRLLRRHPRRNGQKPPDPGHAGLCGVSHGGTALIRPSAFRAGHIRVAEDRAASCGLSCGRCPLAVGSSAAVCCHAACGRQIASRSRTLTAQRAHPPPS